MPDERSKSQRDNSSKFIDQLKLITKTLVRKLERILIKLYRQNMSLLLNKILYIYIYIYIYIYLVGLLSSIAYQPL